VIGTARSWLRRSGDAGDLGPDLKGLEPGGSMLDSWNLVPAEQERVVDPSVGGEETPRLARRLEALHLPLSPPRGLARVLRPVSRTAWLMTSAKKRQQALLGAAGAVIPPAYPAQPQFALGVRSNNAPCTPGAVHACTQGHSVLITGFQERAADRS